jgi:prepilin-type N-terminal cleavage/methylation domain-containing protein
MSRMPRIRLRADRGMTLVELLVAMLLAAFVAGAVVTWMMSAVRAADHHRDDDRAVQDLRQAKERLTRELRMAAELQGASAGTVVVWIDDNSNGEIDAGEVVTWGITEDGELVRSTDAGDQWVVMRNLVPADSGFTFDAGSVEDIRTIGVVLVTSVERGGAARSMTTQIFLRNA